MPKPVISNMGPVDTTCSPYAALKPLPFTTVRLKDGFWGRWQDVNRKQSLEHGYTKLHETGVISNFQIAAGKKDGSHANMFFSDTDLYKWLEAASYELAMRPDEPLERRVDEAIQLIGDAQMDDGYINTYFQITGIEDRWSVLETHEFFCVGHLLQAGVAHARCTGKSTLLEIARRNAAHVDSIFGKGKREGAPDHPGVEMALVELYRQTGEKRYLDLCRYFVDVRGKGLIRGGLFRWAFLHPGLFSFDRTPVRDAREPAGHAVIQVYFLAGAADAYLETGDESLLDALTRLWEDTAATKTSINGGLGVRPKCEAFGSAYELPNEQTYNETCAQIAGVMWSWRMLLATGEAKYADSLEWTLYNGVICGVSPDGARFFYGNTLLSRNGSKRGEWDRCACCPPNVMRTLSSLHAYFATAADRGLQIHLYDSAVLSADIESVGQVEIAMESRYPWDGLVRLRIDSSPKKAWDLSLRIPGWCKEAEITVNGKPEERMPEPGAYLVLRRDWRKGDTVELRLSMPPVLYEAHPYIEPTRCSLAMARGPLLYCLENIDQEAGVGLMDCSIDPSSTIEADWNEGLLQGIVTLRARGFVEDNGDWAGKLYRDHEEAAAKPSRARGTTLTAIPYYAWANRKPSPMRVWIPAKAKSG